MTHPTTTAMLAAEHQRELRAEAERHRLVAGTSRRAGRSGLTEVLRRAVRWARATAPAPSAGVPDVRQGARPAPR